MGNSRRGTPGFFLRYPFGNFWISVIFLCLLSASIMICVVLSIALVIMAPAAQCKSVEKRDIDLLSNFKPADGPPPSLPTFSFTDRQAPIGGDGGVDRQAPIGDGGVMGKMEAPPINNGNMEGLFSGKALDNLQRDVHTDSFKETLQMVAKEYQGKQLRREPSTRGSDHIGQQHVVTCVYCDLDYLVADSSDSAWAYMGSIAGIANMFQLCLGSYSTVMMDANPVEMAKLMAHEYGHMIGIYHDGEIDAAFSGMSGYFDEGQMLADCATEYAELAASCKSTDVGCEGECLMSATVDGTEWSTCSKKYYAMYNCLASIPSMQRYYDDSCTRVIENDN